MALEKEIKDLSQRLDTQAASIIPLEEESLFEVERLQALILKNAEYLERYRKHELSLDSLNEKNQRLE